MRALHIIAFILLVVGGLNWLLVGINDWNVVAYLPEPVARIVYILVGLAALLEVFTHKSRCKNCDQIDTPNQPEMYPRH